ncbi:hypothetical protein BC835DRAFT_1307628 [Cytidiella melzeri]|nr:hypothetical protein BC835DRAFT_1307628 [Cytidiella melzeri]
MNPEALSKCPTQGYGRVTRVVIDCISPSHRFLSSSLQLTIAQRALTPSVHARVVCCEFSDSPRTIISFPRVSGRTLSQRDANDFLSWGLGRVVKIVGGQEVRGILSYEVYVDWAESEADVVYERAYRDARWVDGTSSEIAQMQSELMSVLRQVQRHGDNDYMQFKCQCITDSSFSYFSCGPFRKCNRDE